MASYYVSHTLPRTRGRRGTRVHVMGRCLHVREKDVLPLKPCLNEPRRTALTAALRPLGLKLELLTGANGAVRSQAPPGPDWKHH